MYVFIPKSKRTELGKYAWEKTMKVGKHTSFMIDFNSDFVDGKLDRYFF
jgi:hypothetical protein